MAFECPVGVAAGGLHYDDRPLAEKTLQPLDAVQRIHPETQWAVDSYQDDMYAFLDDPELDIRIVHLTRDVRSWVHSRPVMASVVAMVARSETAVALVPGECTPGQLQASGRPIYRLGYEQLALDPEGSLQLLRLVEVPFDRKMLEPAQHSSSHILSGNDAF